jgi:transposase-like protein
MVGRRRSRSGQAKFDAVMELLASDNTAEAINVERGLTRRALYRRRQQLLEEGLSIFEQDADGAVKAAEAGAAEREQMPAARRWRSRC